jgi:TrmH family RNA methyltransferase
LKFDPFMEEITSRSNQHVQHARAVRDGRERELVFVEGARLVEEVIGAGAELTQLLVTQKFAEESERGAPLIEQARNAGADVLLISESVLDSLADTKTPAGIVLLARRPVTGTTRLEEDQTVPLLVIGHRINNPANAGAILRTAEAAGATGAIFTAESADLFSPKALRGAMGSSFRLPLWTGAQLGEVLSWCRANGITTVGASMDANQTHTEMDWTWRTALVLGPEGAGLSPAETESLDQTVSIPMESAVESLNVAVAAGVLLYEARRQRNSG